MKVGDVTRGRCARRAAIRSSSSNRRRRPRRCRSSRRASRSASACSPTSGSDEFEKYLEKLRGAGDHRVEERGREEGVRGRPGEQVEEPAPRSRRSVEARLDSAAPVVRHLDPLAPRAGRPRAARAEAHRRVPADDHALEPLEGPQEEDRLAAVSRLLLRALRSRRRAAHPEVHRRREHRLVRGQAGADSRVRARQHPPARRQRAAVRSLPADSRRA